MSIVKTFARAALIDVKLTPDEVIRTYGDDVWRFVSSKLSRREDIEDVVMEVFGIAFRNITAFKRRSLPSCGSWWWLGEKRWTVSGGTTVGPSSRWTPRPKSRVHRVKP